MAVADSITSALLRFGRPMTLRRLTWAGDVATLTDVTVYGVTKGVLSHELADGMSSPEQVEVTFSNAQIAAAGWPGPPQQLDQMVIDDGEPRTILGVETKYLGATVLVFVCQLQALSFDRSIRIERFTATVDPGSGEEIRVWSELATVRASKVDISGNEKLDADEVSSTVLTRFRVRWSPLVADVSAKDRIVAPETGRVYEIQTVKEQLLKVGLEIFAVARADE